MAICVVCGKENDPYLCDDCREKADIAERCMDIIKYRPKDEQNHDPVLEKVWNSLDDPYDSFRNIAFILSDELDIPKSGYIKVLSMTGSKSNVRKDSRPWFYDVYSEIKDKKGLSDYELNRLHGIALGAYYMDYDYFKAEEIASYLLKQKELPWQVYYNLSGFYMQTRRYDMAEKAMNDAIEHFSDDNFVVGMMQERIEKNEKQRAKAAEGKKEYMPRPDENIEEVRQKYADFMKSIGIDIDDEIKKSSSAGSSRSRSGSSKNGGINPIPRNEYPEPKEERNSNIDTFVAFDLETTGKISKYHSIIEIGAIKVVNNKVVNKAKFTFQEFVKPLDNKHVSEEITEITGITDDEVQSARPVWEVLPDFLDFAGDNVLLGFNCMIFDSKFMVRAGRYSRRIIENKYFDVMKYSKKFLSDLGIEKPKGNPSLEELAEKLNIKNPRAHRALADAITTAKVFLKLKEMESKKAESNVDDLLNDIDKW